MQVNRGGRQCVMNLCHEAEIDSVSHRCTVDRAQDRTCNLQKAFENEMQKLMCSFTSFCSLLGAAAVQLQRGAVHDEIIMLSLPPWSGVWNTTKTHAPCTYSPLLTYSTCIVY